MGWAGFVGLARGRICPVLVPTDLTGFTVRHVCAGQTKTTVGGQAGIERNPSRQSRPVFSSADQPWRHYTSPNFSQTRYENTGAGILVLEMWRKTSHWRYLAREKPNLLTYAEPIGVVFGTLPTESLHRVTAFLRHTLYSFGKKVINTAVPPVLC